MSLASAILDLGEQMQKMEQMLRDFCQRYAPINEPQSEAEIRIDKFLTGVRNASNMGNPEKLQSSAPFSGAQPASGSLPPPTSLPSPPALPRIYPQTPPPHTAVPLTPAEPRPTIGGLGWAHPSLYFTAPPYCPLVIKEYGIKFSMTVLNSGSNRRKQNATAGAI